MKIDQDQDSYPVRIKTLLMTKWADIVELKTFIYELSKEIENENQRLHSWR